MRITLDRAQDGWLTSPYQGVIHAMSRVSCLLEIRTSATPTYRIAEPSLSNFVIPASPMGILTIHLDLVRAINHATHCTLQDLAGEYHTHPGIFDLSLWSKEVHARSQVSPNTETQNSFH